MCKKNSTLNTNTTLTADQIKETVERKQVALEILDDLLEKVVYKRNEAVDYMKDRKADMQEQYDRYVTRWNDSHTGDESEEGNNKPMTFSEYYENNRDDYYFSSYRKSQLKASVCDDLAQKLMEMILG